MAELGVLVLGVGGNVSQGIQKALARADLPVRVVAACIGARSAGLFRADRAYVSPEAADPAFIAWVIETCEREQVSAVMSGVEPVLWALAPHAGEIRERTGAVCVVSPPEVLAVGQDKLETCRWLTVNGLRAPRFAASASLADLEALAEDCGLPVIAKPRRGKGGEGVAVVETQDELTALADRDDLVVQELLGDPAEEYTTGCFCDGQGKVRGTLTMRRDLLEGTTFRAEAGDFPEVRSTAEAIVRELAPLGPCNVQSRVVDGTSIPFELNVRFSGTTPLRARMGFNEVEAALRHFVLGEPAVELPRVTEGIALRYWNEVYVPAEAVRGLESDGRLDEPWRGVTVEDWGA